MTMRAGPPEWFDDGYSLAGLVELLANAVGDTVSGSELVTQYRDLAEELVAPGHLAFAKQFEAALRFEA
jgi:hypothetical protein